MASELTEPMTTTLEPPAQTQVQLIAAENDDDLDDVNSLAIQGMPSFDDDPLFNPQCHPNDPLLTDSQITPPELLATLAKNGNVHWTT
jgi:hypothetical protein